MSVPLTLLGLLEREPSHGYDLKRDYDAFFGRGKPLPFGQVYATLGRLARDGKVTVGQAEPGSGPDRKRYVITEAGVTEFETWLAEPVRPEPHLQTVLFAKVVLALMLGRPAAPYLDTQRAAHLARMRELTELKRSGGLVDALLADHGLFHLEADLRWIDLTTARLDALARAVRQPPGAVPRPAEAVPRPTAAAVPQALGEVRQAPGAGQQAPDTRTARLGEPR
jgi:DNA-binding PadR family transcriptional regulator